MDVGDKTDMHDLVWPTLGSHAVGALPVRQAARAERHLGECDRCRQRVAGYSVAVGQLAIVGEGSSPELIGMWAWARDRVLRHAGSPADLRASGDC